MMSLWTAAKSKVFTYTQHKYSNKSDFALKNLSPPNIVHTIK